MPVMKLSAFIGERPLVSPRLLPETAAMVARNVRLDDGALTPINKSLRVDDITNAAHTTIFYHQGDFISWPGIVNAVRGPVAQERLYFTGNGVPKVRISGTDYPLAIPRPTAQPVASVAGVGAGDTTSRTYVWTWVTNFGEESAPSPASAIVDWKPGQVLSLSGFTAAPAGRGITKQRIYRSQKGNAGANFFLIAERAATNGDFIDTFAADAFQEPLPSTSYDAPPDGLTGLIGMANGMMAGYSGRDVYFCEPFRPHAWPQKYIMTCDSDVMGLAFIGDVLIVATKAQPYLMAGSHPDSMQSAKLPANLGCIASRGVVSLGFAACYPSSEGLVAVMPDGQWKLATRDMFSREDWLALSPATAHATQHMGSYLMFYDTIDPAGERYAGMLCINVGASEFLVRGSEIATCAYHDSETGAMYFKRAGELAVNRYDHPDATREIMSWRSKEFWTTTAVNYGCALVDLGIRDNAYSQAEQDAEKAALAAQNAIIFASDLMGALNGAEVNGFDLNGDTLLPFPSYGQLTVNVYADRQLVYSSGDVGSIDRLPAGFKARMWQTEVTGNIPVTQIILAETVDQLRQTL